MTESRTIIIAKEEKFDETIISNFKTKFQTKNGTIFLEYENSDISKVVLNNLKKNNIKCKYSFYNIFFRLKKNIDNNNIESIKELIKNKIDNKFNLSNIIFYKKDDKYLGSGYIVVDLFSHYNEIINTSINLTDNNDDKINFYKFYKNK